MAREGSRVATLLGDRPRTGRDGALLAGADDAAILAATALLPGERIVLTTDALEEGVHFRDGWLDLEDLAWKALAVNLSDLAACGAEPLAYLLALAWPASRSDVELARLGAALRIRESAWGIVLAGGDLDVTDGPLRLSVTALGRTRMPLLRSAAIAGDAIFVTGPLGGAAAIVSARSAGQVIDKRDATWGDAQRAFARPEPRLDISRKLAGRRCAVIDLSDGLLPDLTRVLEASGVSARVDLARIPLHAAALASVNSRWLSLEGGEDYELLIAGPEELEARVPGLIRIGAIGAGPPGSLDLA